MKKYFFTVSVVVLAVMAVFAITEEAKSTNYSTYEVNPQINIPPYQGEQVQVAHVFERIVLRYQLFLEDALQGQKTDLSQVLKRLDEIEKKLDVLAEKKQNCPCDCGLSATKPTGQEEIK